MSPGIAVPYRHIWPIGAIPPTTIVGSGQMRVKSTFYSVVAGQILAARYWRSASDGANHVAYVLRRGTPANRELLRAAVFPHNVVGAGPVGWQTVYFEPIALPAGQWMDLVVEWSGGDRSYSAGVLSADYVTPYLILPRDGAMDPFGNAVRNGGIAATLGFNPNGADGANLEAVDINFLPA